MNNEELYLALSGSSSLIAFATAIKFVLPKIWAKLKPNSFLVTFTKTGNKTLTTYL